MKRQSEALLPTPQGNFNMIAYAEDAADPMPHLALVSERLETDGPVLVRIHSECITGDLFGSKRCDCGEQLEKSLELTAELGGIVIYLRQEGRGIGIINKLKAYQLQDQGLNTIDANLHLGLEIDARHYDIAIQMLEDLGVTTIDLLTNNPLKLDAFAHSSVRVRSRLPLHIPAQKENYQYLKTKKDDMGHWLKVNGVFK